MAMKCLNCGAENPEGKQFCSDCGSSIASENAAKPESVGAAVRNARSKWLVPVVAVIVAAAVIAATLFVYYSPDHSWSMSIRDHDGDGYPDAGDAFPYDAAEWTDTDKDGHGDNSDVFPNDATEWQDSDGDAVGDNSDAFPNDKNETKESDGDGVGDNGDKYPHDGTQWSDKDGDGYGDNVTGNNPDIFPDNPKEWNDTDSDGVGDNSDVFPSDGTQSSDRDGDGYGDNATGTNPDAFPDDPSEWEDSDGDGVGDNGDAFPNDPTETKDSDSDGIGDNADWYDFGNGKLKISVDSYMEDGTADFWSSGDPYFIIKVDTNGDSVWDSTGTSGIFTDTSSVMSPYWIKIDYPDNQIPGPVTFTIEIWDSDIGSSEMIDYNPAAGGSYWTVQTTAWPFGNSWCYNGSDDGGYEVDCELQFSVSVSG